MSEQHRSVLVAGGFGGVFEYHGIDDRDVIKSGSVGRLGGI